MIFSAIKRVLRWNLNALLILNNHSMSGNLSSGSLSFLLNVLTTCGVYYYEGF